MNHKKKLLLIILEAVEPGKWLNKIGIVFDLIYPVFLYLKQ